MPTKTLATILEIGSGMSPVLGDWLDFSVPFANKIVVMSSEYASLLGKDSYYGDEMDFKTWDKFKMPIGTKTDNDKIWTLQAGYSYIFYFSKSRFSIFDASGSLVHTRNNIKSIADLHIDFTIHKSHQFVIKISSDDDKFPFIFPTKLVRKVYGESPVFNVTTGTANDELNQYRGESFNNYKIFEVSGLSSKKDEYKTYYRKRINTLWKSNPIVGVKPVSYDIIKNTNAVYSIDGYNYFSDTSDVYNDKADDNAKIITSETVKRLYKIKMLLTHLLAVCPKVSDSILPMYQKVVRPGESHNNRPVYEPWLIWGVLKFIWLKRTKENDDYVIDIFDLSPNWSY